MATLDVADMYGLKNLPKELMEKAVGRIRLLDNAQDADKIAAAAKAEWAAMRTK